ncbi:P-loop containing nucleoside triphosphate hydrolase protein, partial [Desarmillaria tabescens]
MNVLKQSLLPQERAEIRIRHYPRRQAASAAEVLLSEKCLGISIVQATGCDMEYLAIATPDEVAVISLADKYSIFPKDEALRTLLSAKQPILAGFNMPQLSIRLFCQLNYHVHAIDLSTFRSKSPSHPYYPSKLISETMATRFDGFAVDSLWNDRLNEAIDESIRKVCLRAWISVIILARNLNVVPLIKPIETRWLKREVLECLGRLLSEADTLQRAKPTEISNDFSEANMDSDGRLTVHNSRFNTRIRPSPQARSSCLKFESHGKQTEIKVPSRFYGTVASVKVIGREGGTNTEKARDELLLHALQGECHLRHSKFVRMLWFPNDKDAEDYLAVDPIPPLLAGKLNESQKRVVSAMVSNKHIVVVHGPPGTGKTSTISAAAMTWDRIKSPTWIVAHSNVAVKNIAEKLASSNVDFKIIVSKEFYVEWHEHLYTKIEDKLFRGDELPKNPKELGYVIGSSSIILSTLSMLSNPALDQNGMFNLMPPRNLVVDEASQINVFEYMHIFFKFRNVMTKVCFFGDPKQLPPYGKDKASSMQCIFDIDHLKDESHFLNIQYRMPHPLGEFISREVYNNRLRSEHGIKDQSCIAFIDTKTGTEENSGFSWRNAAEIRTIVHLVKSYYKDRNFCIITPYDAQRAAIERELKNNNLPWKSVFNVDSFQ